MSTSADRHAMSAALRQAEKGRGRTAPNPAVGCVILGADGAMVAEGYHERVGEPHAEAIALMSAGAAAIGSTVYVTLEPCSHWGRTPPCADALVRAGVRRVVAAIADPDPRVSGAGFRRLRDARIEVVVGIGAAAARRMNEGYLKVKRTGLPFVVLKMAMTLDGKIATQTGDSRWVTSLESRAYVHRLRDASDAVMVGIGTVLADNPALTVRLDTDQQVPGRTPRNPLRIILDSRARLRLDARVLTEPGHCILITSEAADRDALAGLVSAGAEPIIVSAQDGKPDLAHALRCLADRGIHSILCEGGAEVAASLLTCGLVDRLLVFIAPKVIGGRSAPGPVGGEGLARMQDALQCHRLKVHRFGTDLALETEPVEERATIFNNH